MPMLKKLCIALACTIFFSAGPMEAAAADIFNTTGSAGISTFTYTPPFLVATLFRTTASDFILNSISVQTSNTLGTRAGNIVVRIYSNGANVPVSQVGADLGTFAASGLSTSISLTGLSRTLSPSTNYWLVVDIAGVTGGDVNFRATFSPSGVGSPFFYAQSNNSGASWSTNSGVALAGVITAVPEPGTVLMGIVSAGSLAICGLRRRKPNREASDNRTS
jgi:hypothetical protein